MNADEKRAILDGFTETVIGCAHKVSNGLGCGFLEKIYENALVIELRKAGLSIRQQHPVQVHYEGEIVGVYVADILVEEQVVLEIKAVSALDNIHRAQCMNYLKATGISVGLLLNFGRPKLEVKRMVRNF
jgi:GxxExxY protein